MTLTITKGMNGRKVESLGTFSANEIDKMDKAFAKWKNSKDTQKRYRVQWYDRVLFYKEQRRLVIDFGDYSYFGLIKANKKEWQALEDHKNRPIDLDI